MPDLLIKNVPENLRRRLKTHAKKNHRSMSGHALALIEKGLATDAGGIKPLGKPFELPFLLTDKLLNRAKRQGRE